MGYSDIGCYGGEIETPNLDRLAASGLRFSQFYNTARCSPSRASMLTGLHPHQTGVGILTYDSGPEGYAGNLNQRCVTIPQALKRNGYRTYMSGKWHVAIKPHRSRPTPGRCSAASTSSTAPSSAPAASTIPTRSRAATTTSSTRRARPASSTPTPSATRRSRSSTSTSASTRDRRSSSTSPTPRRTGRCTRTTRTSRSTRAASTKAGTSCARSGSTSSSKGHPARGLEATAARPDAAAVGARREHKAGCCAAWRSTRRRSTAWTRASAASSQALERDGQLDDTLVIFLADNGACAEDIPEGVTIDELVDKLMIARSHTRSGEPVHFGNDPARMPGPENTYQSYGPAWANLSNTPFRLYKHWIHEGGISTPLIVHWPNGIREQGRMRHAPGYLPDIMATILDATGTPYPRGARRQRDRAARRARRWAALRPRRARPPADVLGARGQRRGAHRAMEARAQISRPVGALRHGSRPHGAPRPRRAASGSRRRHGGAVRRVGARCGVIPRDQIVALMKSQGVTRAFWEKDW